MAAWKLNANASQDGVLIRKIPQGSLEGKKINHVRLTDEKDSQIQITFQK